MEPTGCTAHEPGAALAHPAEERNCVSTWWEGLVQRGGYYPRVTKDRGLEAGGMSSVNENINFEMESPC